MSASRQQDYWDCSKSKEAYFRAALGLVILWTISDTGFHRFRAAQVRQIIRAYKARETNLQTAVHKVNLDLKFAP